METKKTKKKAVPKKTATKKKIGRPRTAPEKLRNVHPRARYDSRTRRNKYKMIKALEASLGIVTTAIKKSGVKSSTHYKWLKEDPAYAKRVNSIQNMSIDFVESQLYKQIQEGNVTSIIFYLKCKAKERGYVERQEIKHTGGVNFVIAEDEKDF